MVTRGASHTDSIMATERVEVIVDEVVGIRLTMTTAIPCVYGIRATLSAL